MTKTEFYNIIKEMLESVDCVSEDFKNTVLLDEQMGVLSFIRCPESTNLHNHVPYEKLLEAIIDGINDFVQSDNNATRKKHAYGVYHRIILNLCEHYNISNPEHHVESLDLPGKEDYVITLLKALHDRDGITNKGLQQLLGVKYKTIQNDLRRISPDLCESENAKAKIEPLTIAGVPVNVKVNVNVGKQGEKKYHTPSTVHPINLQLNIMQLATLMEALHLKAETEYDREISSLLAADIWSQVSDYGRERIREVYGKRDREFEYFLDATEMDLESVIAKSFKNDRALIATSKAVLDKVDYAVKSGGIYNFTILEDGLNREIVNC